MSDIMNPPFPDEPNAEICVITGGRANAFRNEMPAFISGWYGSTIADMTRFIVIDPTIPVGPICDEEIEKALEAGRIIEAHSIAVDDLASTGVDVLKALLSYGFDVTIVNSKDDEHEDAEMIKNADVWPTYAAMSAYEEENKVDVIAIGRTLAAYVLVNKVSLPTEEALSKVAQLLSEGKLTEWSSVFDA